MPHTCTYRCYPQTHSLFAAHSFLPQVYLQHRCTHFQALPIQRAPSPLATSPPCFQALPLNPRAAPVLPPLSEPCRGCGQGGELRAQGSAGYCLLAQGQVGQCEAPFLSSCSVEGSWAGGSAEGVNLFSPWAGSAPQQGCPGEGLRVPGLGNYSHTWMVEMQTALGWHPPFSQGLHTLAVQVYSPPNMHTSTLT